MKSRIMDVLKDRELELGPRPPQRGTYQHFAVTRDDEGIAWVLFDRAGKSANTLSGEVMDEFGEIVTALEKDLPKGVVLRSAKTSGFIAGADINEFVGASDANEVQTEMGRANDIMNRFAALPVPTVAVVHGFCLGGGMEVALACKHRIAVDGARFGLPEVQLGLHPGLGGTARLPFLIRPDEAMGLMLRGNTVDARRAKTLGIVDAVTQERHIRNAVRDAIAGKIKQRRPGVIDGLMRSTPIRRFLANQMRKKAKESALPQHYPSPYALIDLWEQHGDNFDMMLAAERGSFAKMMVTPTAQNLIRVFFLREQMKKLADGGSPIEHVHVIGAGAMGGDIAGWCAYRGLRVTLADMKPEPIAGALKRASELYKKILRRSIDSRDALDRFVPDLDGEGVSSADLIIEAVPENLGLKKKIYAGLEPRMKDGAVLASNTSSIPLQDLSADLARPERFVGLHFFNPVSRMQLVEVVSHDRAAPDVLAKARAFTGQIDRLPLPVKSAPGFLVNRALTPYMLEAMVMLDEKIDKETIDAAAIEFGMPMGPIELADQVGLDVCLAVADELRKHLGDAFPPTPDWLRKKVESGELGRKTGKGFYVWKDGKAQKTLGAAAISADMTDRLILPMLNVCVTCLREGIVENPDVVDGAMIFGTGFAPFRGGPIHYARTRGVDNVVAMLGNLASRYGARFKPDPGWDAISSP